ncbi:molybdenum cofactor biosynthesis protein MoeA [Corynebacterium phocae]|uniref:GTP 3',8-cyclase n=1 Tax=Corynebacterium phocae TaxID=161895 RepID=A0A1L7D6I2_9CORY|nr:molybdenum cofactor biosynthesis protein MoeA [Corynebacterium phocae]
MAVSPGATPPPPGGDSQLIDTYGRVARDLRVSLTDRCNLRCTYCMPAEGLDWAPAEQTLSDAETLMLIRLGVEHLGIRQIRFTGGEPLLRKSLPELVRETKNFTTDEGHAPQVAITTNGLGLDRKAAILKAAGLDRVNVSLDSVDRDVFARLTRRDRLDQVVKGIKAARDAGLVPLKINAVLMPGINDTAVVSLTEFALSHGAQLRFIEQMPLGPREAWDAGSMISAHQILEQLNLAFVVRPADVERGSAPAKLWKLTSRRDPELGGLVGIIASVTQPFCGDCDRTRLTADGAVRNCLFGNSETSLRDLLRQGASDQELMAAWKAEMWRKLPGHGVDDEGFLQPARPMSAIGG